jgi:hypothetical protein
MQSFKTNIILEDNIESEKGHSFSSRLEIGGAKPLVLSKHKCLKSETKN